MSRSSGPVIKVRIELPMVLPPGCEYGVFVTNRSQEDGIARLIVNDSGDRDPVALEIHPDGSLHGDTKGWAVGLHEADDGQGMIYIWMCPLCGQPLPKGQRCNSGVHQGPDTVGTEGTENDTRPSAARSIDVVGNPSFTDKELRFMYDYFQYGEAPSSKSITKKLRPKFGKRGT